MQGFEPADETQRSLADALRELQPAPLDVSCERIWYRAGVAAGRRQVNTWRAIAAGAVILAGVSLRFPYPAPDPVEPPRLVADHPKARIPQIAYPVPPEPVDPTPSTSYLALRNGLLEKGIDALPVEMPHQPPAMWNGPGKHSFDRFLPRQLAEPLEERGSS